MARSANKKKSPNTKSKASTGWLAWFGSLTKGTKVLMILMILGVFSVTGTLLIRQSSAYMWSPTVSYCMFHGYVLRNYTANSCAATAQKVLRGDADVMGICRSNGWLYIDGQFGPISAAYTRCYQQIHHLSVDGVVGPQTWQRMLYDCDHNMTSSERYTLDLKCT